jgi:SAM-dependent methyltransferase
VTLGGSRPTRWQAETGHAGGPSYAARMAGAGHGEADLVEALLAGLGRPGRVLDAGCGTGRTTIEIARRGHEVTGVDLDPSMLAEARRAAPGLDWVEADLAALALPRSAYDVGLLAGNVLVFVAPGTERAVLERVATHVRPGGLVVAGFRLEPGGYDLGAYDADCAAVGLELRDRFATWDRASYDGGDYAVSVCVRG